MNKRRRYKAKRRRANERRILDELNAEHGFYGALFAPARRPA